MIYVGTSVSHFMNEYWPDARTVDIDRFQKPHAEHLQPGVSFILRPRPAHLRGQEPG